MRSAGDDTPQLPRFIEGAGLAIILQGVRADSILASRLATSGHSDPLEWVSYTIAAARDQLGFDLGAFPNTASAVAWFRAASDAVTAALIAGTISDGRAVRQTTFNPSLNRLA